MLMELIAPSGTVIPIRHLRESARICPRGSAALEKPLRALCLGRNRGETARRPLRATAPTVAIAARKGHGPAAQRWWHRCSPLFFTDAPGGGRNWGKTACAAPDTARGFFSRKHSAALLENCVYWPPVAVEAAFRIGSTRRRGKNWATTRSARSRAAFARSPAPPESARGA